MTEFLRCPISCPKTLILAISTVNLSTFSWVKNTWFPMVLWGSAQLKRTVIAAQLYVDDGTVLALKRHATT